MSAILSKVSQGIVEKQVRRCEEKYKNEGAFHDWTMNFAGGL